MNFIFFNKLLGKKTNKQQKNLGRDKAFVEYMSAHMIQY